MPRTLSTRLPPQVRASRELCFARSKPPCTYTCPRAQAPHRLSCVATQHYERGRSHVKRLPRLAAPSDALYTGSAPCRSQLNPRLSPRGQTSGRWPPTPSLASKTGAVLSRGGLFTSLLLQPARAVCAADSGRCVYSTQGVPRPQDRQRRQGRRGGQPAGVQAGVHPHARLQGAVRRRHLHLGALRLLRACVCVRV